MSWSRRHPAKEVDIMRMNLFELAKRFTLLTKSSLPDAKLRKSFANFQALILLSHCEVLRKRGIAYETIDQYSLLLRLE